MTGRSFRFLGKKEVFDAPLIGAFARMAGGIRVNRSSGSDEPLEAAIKVLQAGGAISLAPEGTIPRGPAFFEPELRKGRWGAARLAAATGATVYPGGAVGHREGVAAQLAAAAAELRPRPPGDPRARRRTGRPEAPQPGRRHQADHGCAGRPACPTRPGSKRTPTEPRSCAATYPARLQAATRTAEAVRRPGTDT